MFPTTLRLMAEATGIDAGMDGEAFRGWTYPGGDGISFWADLFIADLEIHLIGADSIEFRSPASMADNESRFWHEPGMLPGHTRNANPAAGELAHGTWTCRPMDTPPGSGGYYDPDGTVPGIWRLVATP